MNKKALKIIGVIFGVLLIAFDIYCLIGISYKDDLEYHYARKFTSDGREYGYISAQIPDESGVSAQYDFGEDAAVSLYTASRTNQINDTLTGLLVFGCVTSMLFGAAIIAVSLCIKTETEAKNETSQNSSAPIEPYRENFAFCASCGAQMQVNQKFCPKCGHFAQEG